MYEHNHEASVKAVRSVEEAMENMYEAKDSGESIRTRAAQAALDRITRNTSSTSSSHCDSNIKIKQKFKWIFETPTQLDIDELRECIVEAMTMTCGKQEATNHMSK